MLSPTGGALRIDLADAAPPPASTDGDGMPPGHLELDSIYREHADFVWRCLQRFGVPKADLPDLLHEVFLVVHRKLAQFEGRSRLTTWLYGIALRVATRHRQRLRIKRETSFDAREPACSAPGPGAVLERRQAERRLQEILDLMPAVQRAVFVMFELEGLTCEQIAAYEGTKVGTVYSRLHYARKLFTRALEEPVRGGKIS